MQRQWSWLSSYGGLMQKQWPFSAVQRRNSIDNFNMCLFFQCFSTNRSFSEKMTWNVFDSKIILGASPSNPPFSSHQVSPKHIFCLNIESTMKPGQHLSKHNEICSDTNLGWRKKNQCVATAIVCAKPWILPLATAKRTLLSWELSSVGEIGIQQLSRWS